MLERRWLFTAYVGSNPSYEMNDNDSYSEFKNKDWLYGDYRNRVLSVSFADDINITDCSRLFEGLSRCSEFSLQKLHTSGCASFKNMFNDCNSLGEIDLSHLDFSSGEDYSQMFIFCKHLSTVDFGNADFSHAKNFSQMFDRCTALSSVYFGNTDFSSVTNFDSMFYDCSILHLNCSKWNVSSAQSAIDFSYISAYVILPNWGNTCTTVDSNEALYNNIISEKQRKNSSLERVLAEKTPDGMRSNRSYYKYNYYLNGDYVGTKTSYLDGHEEVKISDKYKDDYQTLP